MSRKAAPVITAAEARRMLLLAQGMLVDPKQRVTVRSLQRLIEQLGYVQIDSINIVRRAHHLTLGSRLDQYQPAILKRLHEERRTIFEQWTHDASLIPAAFFPYWQPRFDEFRRKSRGSTWWKTRLGDDPKRTVAKVRDRLSREGPLQSKDFHQDGSGPSGPWWGWKPHKIALEYLWRTGEAAIAARVNFHKVYDLTERVLPEVHDRPAPSRDEYVDWCCREAISRLGIATPTEIAGFWGGLTAADARRWCEDEVNRGELLPVIVESADDSPSWKSFAVKDWMARLNRAPSVPDRIRLLSPFDPVIRDRRRLKRLFDFDYRFEAFTPAAKRIYGYYVLPVLEGERFVGRIDPKFHREKGMLEIRRVWWESPRLATKRRMAQLEEATNRLAAQLGAEEVKLPARAAAR